MNTNTKKHSSPNYKDIYKDILHKKFPDKIEKYKHLMDKEIFSAIDVIEINNKIFGITRENEKFNQSHRSYTKDDILKILRYQQEHQLNNKQVAIEFKLSRNSITKWKKLFKF